jgi:hypothetical protein
MKLALYIIQLILAIFIIISILMELFRMSPIKPIKKLNTRDWLMIINLFIGIILSLLFLF